MAMSNLIYILCEISADLCRLCKLGIF